MNKYVPIILCILMACSNFVSAQVEGEQKVISSGGQEYSSPNLQVSSTIGETVVTTRTSGTALVATQGFHQTFERDSLVITIITTDASCIGRNNGTARIIRDSIKGCDAPYTIIWSTGMNPIDSTEAVGLGEGNYSVTILSANGCQSNFPFSIGTNSNAPCVLTFFSGITPNNDGISDFWMIENIEDFPQNKVTIFNRLGNIVFEENNYNNSTVKWGGENLSGNELPSDTYFYVFEANGEFQKGWIELTR